MTARGVFSIKVSYQDLLLISPSIRDHIDHYSDLLLTCA
jgi:hypothetical protein